MSQDPQQQDKTKASEEDENAPVQITSLPIDALRQLQQSVTEQRDYFSNAFDTFQLAKNGYTNSNTVLDSFTEANHDKQIMIPITDSLYIPGKLKTDKVLVDLGVGYFAEQTPQQAKGFFERKIKFVHEKMETVKHKIDESQNSLDQIQGVLQTKIAELNKQDTQDSLASNVIQS